MTLIGACRDAFRVIRTEPGTQPEELKPALDEVELLSGQLDWVWHDGWRGYALLVYENEQTVVHPEEFVTDDGVHINQVECLWSLVNPWLQNRGLSKPGLEQSVRPYGFVPSLNLVGAPVHGLLVSQSECFAELYKSLDKPRVGYRCYRSTTPPEILSDSPTMFSVAFVNKKAIVLATSSGSVIWSDGILPRSCSRWSS